MDGANGQKQTTLSVNVLAAPGKAMVGEFDQMTKVYPHRAANQSQLMFGFPGA